MKQSEIPAVFMRGGTSKGLFFQDQDLPREASLRDPLFLKSIGSPDRYGRQLNGMGGGLSSLSKVAIVGCSKRPGIDLEFTFGQVVISEGVVDYGATCGNLSSAVGPFAVNEGLLRVEDGLILVRIYNTNTRKVFESQFEVVQSEAAVEGTFSIPGVAGSGACVRLDYLDPGGALTGALLPTSTPVDILTLSDGLEVEVSCVDATTPCVFVLAKQLGLTGSETPEQLESNMQAMARFEEIRGLAGVLMGLGSTTREISDTSRSAPKIACVAPPQNALTIDDQVLEIGSHDVSVRMISMGQVHRAVPLTGAMCLAIAASLKGTIVNSLTKNSYEENADLKIGTPSGVLPAAAQLKCHNTKWIAERVTVYRTMRPLMKGVVFVTNS